MTDFSHLDALRSRLHREGVRLADARAALAGATPGRRAAVENEIAFREREIASCEREIAGEYRFLGIEPPPSSVDDLSDDQLLAELSS